MNSLESGTHNGIACLWLRNGRVRLAVSTALGPRILFCGWDGGPNIFAELGELAAGPPTRPFRLHGGHRLWHAPESLERTYWPDDTPVTVENGGAGTTFTAPPDGAGIVKQLTITLADSAPRVTVRHLLRNTGLWPIALAPWAISACRLGGVTLLPLPREASDPDGLLPNRQLALWPYSDLTDSRLTLGNRLVLVDADPGPPNKVGTRSADGWIAYWIDGTLFVKHYQPDSQADYPDLGCNIECYVNDAFIEVETLGSLVTLEPGRSTVYEEVWRLIPMTARPASEPEALEVVYACGLSTRR